ncbi:hypothetical protein [Nitrosomonas oligotropha]|uniref:Uncharacterized protein n=1 Tax=Nitrosomonas oligotropha TaxID=42354 RepID=A0A1H8SW08_9PROT|nr:hypothetical protein [Nitrosomonas oligotropha]SDX18308.1 hypothetical protein SAMN05216300_12152 [Nitrosomonas oligotropha]SEO82656.1 hypothetical protein SAMN05216333_12052 [Nitrosomonas oligotropha]
MENLKSARSAHAELLTRRSKFQDKKQSCDSMTAEIHAKLANLEHAHILLERRYICDEANMQQVQASRAEIESERAKLAEAERLKTLAQDAVREIDQQILQAELATAAAQREFCAEQRNAAIAKIKDDTTLRKNLIAAMVANAGSGAPYSFQAAAFAGQFIHQLLPQISEAEVRAELDRFKSSNKLE